MIKIFFLLNLLYLLVGCTYQYTDEDNFNKETIIKTYLNVKSFEVKKENLSSTRNNSLLSDKINDIVLKNLETWAWEKFVIRGKENIAYLNLLKIDTNLVEKSRKKKSIVSIINKKKEIYNIALNFDLIMIDNQNLIKKIKISSNLDLVLLDNYSITQRDKVIIYNAEKLIKLIDKKINSELKKDVFKNFLIK